MNEHSQAPASDAVRAAHRRVTIIVRAMISSLFVYAIVVEAAGRTGLVGSRGPASEVVRLAFYAVAVSTVFISHVLKAFLTRNVRAASEQEALGRLATATIATAAVAETPAVLGLVLFFVGPYYTDFYFMAVISAYLFVRHYPRYSAWEAFVRRQAAAG